MKSSLKIAVPVIVFIAVIFGLTFFSQYTPTTDDESKNEKGASSEPPLRFFASTRFWDPPDFASPHAMKFRGLPMLAPSADKSKEDTPFKFSVQDRIFPGYFEIQSDAVGPKNSADFWFENRHPNSVWMHLEWISCGDCSAGWVAPIPPDVAKQMLQSSFASALPQGLFNGLPLGMVGPAANLNRLDWQKYSFRDSPNVNFKVPAADNADGWSPQWGILKLQFSVGAKGPKIPPLTAVFQTVVEGTKITETNKFMIAFEGISAFEVSTVSIDVGEMNENSEPRRYEIIAFSSTRGPGRITSGDLGDLYPPTARVTLPLTQRGDPGEFVKISEPVRVPDAELASIAEMLAARHQQKRQYRIESAYKYQVTVNPKIGDARIDLGQMDRDIYFSLAGVEHRVAVKGLVTGVVWLDNNQHEIEVPRFDLSKGYAKEFNIITARYDAVLKLIESESRPKYLQVSLERNPKPPSGDRGYYILKLRIPPSSENVLVKPGTWNGEVVMEVKGEATQRIRIPLSGRIDPK